MHWFELEGKDAIAQEGADLLEQVILSKPEAHLVLATGASPQGLYAEVARRVVKGRLITRHLWITKLDEWVGIDPTHPASCEAYLNQFVLGPWEIDPARYLSFDGKASEPEAEVNRFRRLLRQGPPIDVAVLGVGKNGHIALNEPFGSRPAHTHVSQLAAQTRFHSLLLDLENPPTHGLTMGLADLFSADQLLLLLSGEDKQAVAKALAEPILRSDLPASLLHLHPRCFALVDRMLLA